jgi:hypothetical protein
VLRKIQTFSCRLLQLKYLLLMIVWGLKIGDIIAFGAEEQHHCGGNKYI